MPNIRQYDAPQGMGLQPTEMGIDANVQSARRAGAFFNQAADATKTVGDMEGRMADSSIKAAGQVAVDYVDSHDRSKTSAAATGGLATLEQNWQQTLKGTPDPDNPGKFLVPPADPNDGTVAAKFQKEQVEPFLESLKKIPIGENGQKYAEAKSDEIRQHISNKMTADMSTQAGNARVLNRITTVNNLGSLVTTDPSFTTVDFALKQSQDDMAAHSASPTLTADQVGKLKIHQAEDEMKIVHAAVASAISKSPNPEATAASFVARYPGYIKGDQENQLAKAATAQNKFNASLDRAQQAQVKQEAVQGFNAKINEITTRNIQPDGSIGPSTPQDFKDLKDLVNHPGADYEPGRLSETYKFLESRASAKDVVTDPVTYNKLANGLADGTTHEIDLIKAANNKKIADRDYTALHTRLENIAKDPGAIDLARERKDFIKRYELTIDPTAASSDGRHSALGEQQIFKMGKELERQEAAIKKQPNGDPMSLYDPTSPNYFGKPGSIQRYRVTAQQASDYQANLAGDGKGRSSNLTGPGKTETGTEMIEVPPGMSPAEVMKQYKSGQRIKLPDGRMGTVP